MKNRLCAVTLLAGALGAGQAAAADAPKPDPRARFMAANCAYCHGPEGRSLGAIPSLDGLEPGYFVAQMKAFRDGSRPGTVMQKHAAGYTEAEYAALAKYFAAVK
jgi:cytochrome c553